MVVPLFFVLELRDHRPNFVLPFRWLKRLTLAAQERLKLSFNPLCLSRARIQ